MFEKKEETPPSLPVSQGFFSPFTNQENCWQIISSNSDSTLLFNSRTKLIVGLGDNRFVFSNSDAKKTWTIPLRRTVNVKQIAAGTSHILILYDNGELDGYGRGYSGQLGIGSYSSRNPKTFNIKLPNGETPKQIAAAEYYSLVITQQGHLYGFGDNRDGQLGLGEEKEIEFPTQIPLPNNSIAKQFIQVITEQ